MREIFEYILSTLKSRLVPVILAFIVMFVLLIGRLFSIQIVNGNSYMEQLNNSIEMTTSVPATRGRIYDKNGKLLAYNELAFAVKISDSDKYTDIKTKNQTINSSIEKALNIIESKGDKFFNEFQIIVGSNGEFQFNVSGNSLLRFKRDVYGVSKIADLSDNQVSSSASEIIDYLCSNDKYQLDISAYSKEHLLEILSLRISMSANSYNRYMSFTIANDVSDDTVAAILENADSLSGITVEQQYVRKYTNSIYCSQILGYTGTVSSSELDALREKDDSYESNDIVGKTGIEQSMESELSGKKGSKTVYVDTVGRITEVVDETPSEAGHDVYLTIDADLQEKIYNIIEDELVKILLKYISAGDTKYTYTSTGDIDTIYIPIKEVYFALIDNNLISLNKMEMQEHPAESEVFSTFETKKDTTLDWIADELKNASTPYGQLSEENQAYIWYIYKDLLYDKGVFNKDKIDSNDEVYRDWTKGNSTSLTDLLKYSITKDWIDMSQLSSQQYTSLQESYDELVNYIMNNLQTDHEFYKKMYKYMIQSGQISGNQLCRILFEQGFLEDDGSYAALTSGSRSAYDFMISCISNKIITPGQLALKPCSGSAVMTDPNSGKVLALVSYPSYDNNKMSGSIDNEYYNMVYNDKSTPLRNWATQAQSAPGSTFKICSSVAGIDTGVIDTSYTYFCSGSFTEVTPAPRCWLHSGHGTENVTTAIRDSCNVFFYNVGYRLACSKTGIFNDDYGTSVLQKYAEQMGLATTSGIEIAESIPHASNTQAIQSAIGQGNAAYSALNLARYCSTIANSGTCYNLTLIDKITDYDGNTIRENEPDISNKMDVNPAIWDAVHSGMHMVQQSYAVLNPLKINIGCKTGTAQVGANNPDCGLMICYAPLESPEISMGISIQNGYSSANAAEITAEILKDYFSLE